MTSCKSVTELPDELKEIFHLAKTEYNQNGVFFLEESYILDIQKRLSPYPNILEELIPASHTIIQFVPKDNSTINAVTHIATISI